MFSFRTRIPSTKWVRVSPPCAAGVKYEGEGGGLHAQIGPARGAWFNIPEGNLLALRQGPVPVVS